MDYAVFDSLIDSVEEEEGQERRTRARERSMLTQLMRLLLLA